MSLAEIKQPVEKLSAEEQRSLAEFLRERADKNIAARRDRVDAIMKEMDAGRKFQPLTWSAWIGT